VNKVGRRRVFLGVGGVLAASAAGGFAWVRATGSMTDYDAYASRLRSGPGSKPESSDLVRYAALAANGHNTQPWRFSASENEIQLSPDLGRRTPVVDPDDHHLHVSLGCAAENLTIAARATGWTCEAVSEPDGGVTRFILGAGRPDADPLFDAILKRQSTRTIYDGRPVSSADLAELERAGARAGVRTVLLTDRARMGELRDLAVAGDGVQMTDPAFLGELKAWLRFNPRGAMAGGDGLFAAASGNPNLPDAFGPRAFDLFVTETSENDKLARQIDSSSGIAVFVGDRADRAHWFAVGRACQRFLLTATRLGLKCAFINQPVEVARLRPELAALIGEPDKRPDIVVRFGYGPTMPYAPRRPVEDILTRIVG